MAKDSTSKRRYRFIRISSGNPSAVQVLPVCVTLPPMRKAYICFGDGSISTDASPENLARAWNDPQAKFWLDIFPPDDSDVAILRDVFHFHPLAIEDSITYTQRPKIEHYDDSAGGYCYLV